MPSGSDNGSRISGIPPVPPTPPTVEETSPPESSLPEVTTVPQNPDKSPLPIRFADLEGLRRVLEGQITASPFENLISLLRGIANPTVSGGFDFEISSRNGFYRLVQAGDGGSLELTVTQEIREGPDNTPARVQKIKITYLPDGQVLSSLEATPHPQPQGAEKAYHNIFNTLVRERAQRIKEGNDLYVRIQASLEALRGRPTPETQSVWYDNFAVQGPSAYTFRRGYEDFHNPQLNQISIFADTVSETGAQRTEIATLSANGEINYQPGPALREPLGHEQIGILQEIATSLEQARRDPAAYQRTLHRDLVRLAGPQELRLPQITRSVDIQRSFGMTQGAEGEAIMRLRTWKDIIRVAHPSLPRWLGRSGLTPRGRLKFWMNLEMGRWFFKRAGYTLFGNLFNPGGIAPERGDWIQLHLFPKGGGRLDFFREGHRHEVIVGEERGPLWHGRSEIKRMTGRRPPTPTPISDLQAALAHRASGSPLPVQLHLKPSPRINLDRIHLNPDGTPLEVTNAETAWKLIQAQFPSGIEARVQMTTNERLSRLLLPTEINHIKVDLSQYHPPLSLEISHSDIPEGSGTVRRVEVIMDVGQNSSARVWENGQLRPDLARDVFRRELVRAQEGHVPRHLWTLGFQLIPKIYGFYKYNGAAFGLSYFGTLPLIMGYEHLIYNDGEQRRIGTPLPEFSWKYAGRNVVWPFMKLSTASGVASLAVDGTANLWNGGARTLNFWRNADVTLSQAYRMAGVSVYNPNPKTRPLGGIFRGFCQRAIPLFAGLAAIQYFDHGRVNTPSFWHNARDVGMVSLGSSALIRGMMASRRLSGWASRVGLFEATGMGAAESRFALTFWGSLAVTTLEMLALGIINAHEKRALLVELQENLRKEVGYAIDRRNELITRLDHGEEIPPQQLLEADQDLQQAQATYRRLLQTLKHRAGSENYSALTLANDFQEEYDRFETQRALFGQGSSESEGPMALAQMTMGHQRRLDTLRERHDRMQRELGDFYRRHGIPSPSTSQEESLSSFLNSRLRQVHENPEIPQTAAPAHQPATDETAAVSSPLAVDSEEGRMILEQFRWKAARDPAFLYWSPQHKAQYLLEQFSGFQVTQSDGTVRDWNRQDALAFLAAVDRTNARRAQNLEQPLTLPQEGENFNSTRLTALLEEETEIRRRERLTHTHTDQHARLLADNVEDLDHQMADYYTMSNEHLARALERFVEPQLLARNELLLSAY